MRFICKVGGEGLEHIFLAEKMREDFFLVYPRSETSHIVSNASALPDAAIRINERSNRVRLGHLSNLGFEKGLDRVVKTFERLHELGVQVELHLAGPPETKEVEDYILKIQQGPFTDYIVYYGSVYGKSKSNFYESIDVFLLPSLYKHEAQPNVVLEAAQRGVPTVATDVGCLEAEIVENINGFIVSDAERFPELASSIIRDIIAKSKLDAISASTLENIKLKIESSKIQLDTLIYRLTSSI